MSNYFIEKTYTVYSFTDWITVIEDLYGSYYQLSTKIKINGTDRLAYLLDGVTYIGTYYHDTYMGRVNKLRMVKDKNLRYKVKHYDKQF